MNAGRELNVFVTGEGEPTLVFVHGFGCEIDDWQAQIDALSPTFRCVALDLPGHGASGMPQEPTMAALAAAVNVAKARSGARKVILIGHSLGAKVIREAYCQSSSDVVGMILIEGAFYEGLREPLVQKAKDAIDSAGFSAFAQRHFGAMFVEGSDPQLRERVLARVHKLDPRFGRALYLEAVGWDPLRGKDTLKKLAIPVLVLQSTYVDSEFKRKPLQPGAKTPLMEAVASLVPKAEIKVIPGCGHFPLIEAADVVNQAIREFAKHIASYEHEL